MNRTENEFPREADRGAFIAVGRVMLMNWPSSGSAGTKHRRHICCAITTSIRFSLQFSLFTNLFLFKNIFSAFKWEFPFNTQKFYCSNHSSPVQHFLFLNFDTFWFLWKALNSVCEEKSHGCMLERKSQWINRTVDDDLSQKGKFGEDRLSCPWQLFV